MSSVLRAIFCCGSRPVDSDDDDAVRRPRDDDKSVRMRITPENGLLMNEWVSLKEKIKDLEKQLDGLDRQEALVKGMFNRKVTSYTPKEKAKYDALLAARPFNLYQLPSPAETSAPQKRAPASKIGERAKTIQEAVEGQKYVNGMKIGNWDSVKNGALLAILRQEKAKNLSEEEVIQAINAISRQDIRGEFAQIDIPAIWPKL